MTSQTKVSVITVVRNGNQYIEQCIQSIIYQTYPNIEYIIIDGQSIDDTVSIIQKYEENISYWISEKDTGIYDGMNKGVLAATGDWLLFINSDDFLVHTGIIQQSIPYLEKTNKLVVYGKIHYILPSGDELSIGLEWEKVKDSFRNITMYNVCHQAVFHSKELFQNNLYNTNYKLAGDYELLYRHLKNNDADFIPFEISKMRGGGSSVLNYKNLFLENCRIFIQNRKYNFFFTPYFIKYIISTYMHYFSNKLFGPNLVSRLKSLLKM